MMLLNYDPHAVHIDDIHYIFGDESSPEKEFHRVKLISKVNVCPWEVELVAPTKTLVYCIGYSKENSTYLSIFRFLLRLYASLAFAVNIDNEMFVQTASFRRIHLKSLVSELGIDGINSILLARTIESAINVLSSLSPRGRMIINEMVASLYSSSGKSFRSVGIATGEMFAFNKLVRKQIEAKVNDVFQVDKNVTWDNVAWMIFRDLDLNILICAKGSLFFDLKSRVLLMLRELEVFDIVFADLFLEVLPYYFPVCGNACCSDFSWKVDIPHNDGFLRFACGNSNGELLMGDVTFVKSEFSCFSRELVDTALIILHKEAYNYDLNVRAQVAACDGQYNPGPLELIGLDYAYMKSGKNEFMLVTQHMTIHGQGGLQLPIPYLVGKTRVKQQKWKTRYVFIGTARRLDFDNLHVSACGTAPLFVDLVRPTVQVMNYSTDHELYGFAQTTFLVDGSVRDPGGSIVSGRRRNRRKTKGTKPQMQQISPGGQPKRGKKPKSGLRGPQRGGVLGVPRKPRRRRVKGAKDILSSGPVVLPEDVGPHQLSVLSNLVSSVVPGQVKNGVVGGTQ